MTSLLILNEIYTTYTYFYSLCTGGAPNEDNNTNATNAGNGGEQELAISAIMQSLIKDSAQFEEEHSKKQLVSNPQLPTCPVPQASLSNMSCNRYVPKKMYTIYRSEVPEIRVFECPKSISKVLFHFFPNK